LIFKNFKPVVDILHFRMDRGLRANFPAQAAGDAATFLDFNFHSG